MSTYHPPDGGPARVDPGHLDRNQRRRLARLASRTARTRQRTPHSRTAPDPHPDKAPNSPTPHEAAEDAEEGDQEHATRPRISARYTPPPPPPSSSSGKPGLAISARCLPIASRARLASERRTTWKCFSWSAHRSVIDRGSNSAGVGLVTGPPPDTGHPTPQTAARDSSCSRHVAAWMHAETGGDHHG